MIEINRRAIVALSIVVIVVVIVIVGKKSALWYNYVFNLESKNIYNYHLLQWRDCVLTLLFINTF